MDWSDTALILSLGRFREADIWVRMLTRRHGIVSAFAFGGSRSRKRFCGCLDICNELQISTRTTRNGQYLSLLEGNLIQGPHRLRTDLNRLGMFMNCVRFLEALGVPPDGLGSVTAFLLLKDTLSLLEEADTIQDIFPVLFRLRLASQQGYAPALDKCVSCGRPIEGAAGFLVAEGCLVCPECSAKRGNIVEISGKSLDVLRQVQEKSPAQWHFVTSVSSEGSEGALLPAERRECARAVDGFVQYHLGLSWDKGRFRRV